MDLALFFYLADVVSNFSGVFAISFEVLGVILGVATIFFPVIVDLVEGATLKVFYKWGMISLVIVALVGSLLPSKNTMYTMAAAYGVQTAAENPNVQRMAGKSLQVLESKLDEYLKENKKAE